MRKPIGKTLRFKVLEKAGFSCVYCGAKARDGAVLEVDHIHPVFLCGTNEEKNLAAACFECNRGKRARTLRSLPGGFLGWLLLQAGRDDTVGDLADDHVRHPLAGEPKTFKELAAAIRGWLREEYVRGGHGDLPRIDDLLGAGWQAWREWRTGAPTKVTAAIRRDTLRTIKESQENNGGYYLKAGWWSGGVYYEYRKKAG